MPNERDCAVNLETDMAKAHQTPPVPPTMRPFAWIVSDRGHGHEDYILPALDADPTTTVTTNIPPSTRGTFWHALDLHPSFMQP